MMSMVNGNGGSSKLPFVGLLTILRVFQCTKNQLSSLASPQLEGEDCPRQLETAHIAKNASLQ